MYKFKNDPVVGQSAEGHLGRPTGDELIPEDVLRRNEALIEQISKDLDGMVPRCEIERMLDEVALDYKDARIQTFVPIFLRREVTLRFRKEMAQSYKSSSFAPGKEGDSSSTDFVEDETAGEG